MGWCFVASVGGKRQPENAVVVKPIGSLWSVGGSPTFCLTTRAMLLTVPLGDKLWLYYVFSKDFQAATTAAF